LEIPWLGTPDDSGLLRKNLSIFRHAMVRQCLSYKPSRRRIVAKLPIAQNNGINDLTTLHTTLRGKLRLADAEE
jgi:hypothetical protein